MSFDPYKLADLVADPANASQSDDALTTLFNTPTGRAYPPGKIVYATLASQWGPVAADAFVNVLQSHQADAGDFGAFVRSTLRVLTGAGFDASDPQSLAVANALLGAGLCTSNQVDGVFGPLIYPAGGIVQTSDVTAARATLARDAAFAVAMNVGVNQYNSFVAWMDAKRRADLSAPTAADVLAFMGAAQ